MLKSLEIKNYALIQNQTISLGRGLNIITGETGAGKSILLGALGLIMGKRADSKVLFDTTNKCVVEGRFDVKGKGFEEFFEENDIDYDDELVIRREIAVTGKSRAFINDSPATLDLIQVLTDLLIDLHQQFDTLAMFKPKFQLEAIDAIAENGKLLTEYKKGYTDYKQKEKKLDELKDLENKANKEKDYYSFLWKELNEAKFVQDEQKELESNLEIMSNAEDIKRISSATAIAIAAGDQTIVDSLTDLGRTFSAIAKIDGKFNTLYERLLGSIEELRDIASEAESIADQTDADPATLFAINERLNLLYKLEKKHNLSDVNELISLEEEYRTKLHEFENTSSDIEKLEIELSKLNKALMVQAKTISDKRSGVVAKFEKEISGLLTLLSMPNAKLKVKITQGTDLNASGIDNVQFLFATNKGSDFLPLKDVASGGELSRLTLCIKSLLTHKMNLPTMIFDEIDTGVSGEVASKMGLIIKDMAANHQMISITHSPQIASKADVHYWVYKEDEANRTVSKMKILTHEERIVEIAKMLSGDKPGKAALDNARELIGVGK
jgi:DNA repair protein RecN (Recombination protein N)